MKKEFLKFKAILKYMLSIKWHFHIKFNIFWKKLHNIHVESNFKLLSRIIKGIFSLRNNSYNNIRLLETRFNHTIILINSTLPDFFPPLPWFYALFYIFIVQFPQLHRLFISHFFLPSSLYIVLFQKAAKCFVLNHVWTKKKSLREFN